MEVRIGINGFGRIGRSILRAMKKLDRELNVVAINDLFPPESLALLLKYDSVHGHFPGTVELKGGNLMVDGKEIRVFAEREPEKLPWGELGVEIVIESTGVFRKKAQIEKHLEAGTRQVVLTVPAKDEVDATVVLGVNDDILTGEEKIISNASCTTNCAAPIAKIMHENFGIRHGYLMTAHAYTMDQRLHDSPHKDMRRARSAALSIVPTTTGAARAVGKVFPQLAGKMDGMAYRVPTADGSIVDLVLQLEKEVTVEEINQAVKKAAMNEMKGIVQYNEDPLVSMDIVGNTHSAIFDAPLTKVVKPDFVKVSAWYDNELGYSCRVVELVHRLIELQA